MSIPLERLQRLSDLGDEGALEQLRREYLRLGSLADGLFNDVFSLLSREATRELKRREPLRDALLDFIKTRKIPFMSAQNKRHQSAWFKRNPEWYPGTRVTGEEYRRSRLILCFDVWCLHEEGLLRLSGGGCSRPACVMRTKKIPRSVLRHRNYEDIWLWDVLSEAAPELAKRAIGACLLEQIGDMDSRSLQLVMLGGFAINRREVQWWPEICQTLRIYNELVIHWGDRYVPPVAGLLVR